MEKIFYVISISLQVSGAILLLISWLRKTEKIVAENYFTYRYITFEDIKRGEIEVDTEKIKEILNMAYLNRISFVMIAMGYILGIFGEVVGDKVYLAIYIILLSTCLIVVVYWITAMISKKNSKEQYWNMVVQGNVPEGTVVFGVETIEIENN